MFFVCFTHSVSLTVEGILLTYPVRYEMVEAQTVGECVVLSCVPLVVDLRELKGYEPTLKRLPNEDASSIYIQN